jgi:hypothetical protein
MKAKTTGHEDAGGEHSEILILAGGKILAHNITPAMAKVLSELNPEDEAMSRRAAQKHNLKSEGQNLNCLTDELPS